MSDIENGGSVKERYKMTLASARTICSNKDCVIEPFEAHWGQLPITPASKRICVPCMNTKLVEGKGRATDGNTDQ